MPVQDRNHPTTISIEPIPNNIDNGDANHRVNDDLITIQNAANNSLEPSNELFCLVDCTTHHVKPLAKIHPDDVHLIESERSNSHRISKLYP